MKPFQLASFLVLFSSLLLGCSGKTGETKTSFDVKLGGLTSIISVAGGGAMIYGNGPAGSFGKRIDNLGGETVSLEIPNGNWNFSIVIWDGDNDGNPVTPGVPLTGMVRCGVSLGNELTGGDVTILLEASNANCTDPVFSPDTSLSAGEYSFPEFVPKGCRVDLSTVADETAAECTNENEGFVHSIRYMLVPFKNVGGEIFDDFGDALVGPCISKNAAPGDPNFTVRENIHATPSAANLMGGNPAFADSVFKTVVRAYYGETAECDETDPRGFTEIIYPKGLNEIRPVSRVISWDVGGGIKERALLFRTPDDLACAPPRGDLFTDFSVGGTKFYYNGICNGAQFDLIPLQWVSGDNYSTKNFVLLKNINYLDGVDLTAGEPSWPQHTMIGSDFTGNPNGEPTQYTGIFDGNDKSIVAMRMDYEDEAGPISDIGFVRNMGAGAVVKNLTFNMPEIWADSYSDHSYIGIVAGLNNGGTIDNVTIIAGSVEGKTNVGLVAGQFGGGTISNVDSDHSEVEGVSSVGGLVGLLVSGTILDSEFRGFLNKDGPDGTCAVNGYSSEYDCEDVGQGNSTWTDANSFGGIAGQANGGSIIGSTSKGIVLGHTKVGGIVGSATSAAVAITDSYSICSVIATGEYEGTGSSFVGGIQGEAQGNNMITRSFHSLGSVFGPGTDVGPMNGGGAGTPTFPDSFGTSTTTPNQTYAGIRTVATMTAANYTNGNGWYMDDDGFDLPRRDYEAVRPCSGKFAGTFAGGDGSQDNPYEICNAAQFANISSQMGANVHYEIARPIDMSGLTAMTSNALISNGAQAFQGILEGNNVQISNVYGSLSSPAGNIGLFSTIGSSGVLKNLLVVGKIDITSGTQGYDVGLVAGLNEGVVDRVTTFGQVSSEGTDGFGVGGIVGHNKGVIIGSRGNSVVQGNNYVGGITGINDGGLIAYSVFGGKVTPKQTNVLAEYLGGFAGYNTDNGGVKNYYDPSYEETISYDGDIIDSSLYGELSAQFGPGNADQAAMRKAGLGVGENNSYISDIEAYGRIFLQYRNTGGTDDVPVFTEVDPVTSPGQADGSLIQADTASAGDNMMGINTTWAIGDAVWGHNGTAVKLPDFNIDNSIATPGSSQVLPVYEFGGIIGVNSAAAYAYNIYWSGGIDYNGAQYFVPTFGYLVGENLGTIEDTIVQGGFNYPGGNTEHIDDTSGNYMVYRSMSGDNLIVEVDTGVESATVITADTISDGSFGVSPGDDFALGSYYLQVSSSNATSITHTGTPMIESGTSLPIFVQDMQFNDTNYPDFFEIDLGWLVADDYDDPLGHWRVRNGGNEAGLIRPEGYEENLRRGEFIEMLQQFQ